jgi:hypothetical protein
MDPNVITTMKEKSKRTLGFAKIIGIIVVLFIIVLILNPFVMVGPGERGGELGLSEHRP